MRSRKRVKAFNQHIIKGGNNTLKTSNPQLANEWHPTKNGELMPNNVSPRSGKKFGGNVVLVVMNGKLLSLTEIRQMGQVALLAQAK